MYPLPVWGTHLTTLPVEDRTYLEQSAQVRTEQQGQQAEMGGINPPVTQRTRSFSQGSGFWVWHFKWGITMSFKRVWVLRMEKPACGETEVGQEAGEPPQHGDCDRRPGRAGLGWPNGEAAVTTEAPRAQLAALRPPPVSSRLLGPERGLRTCTCNRFSGHADVGLGTAWAISGDRRRSGKDETPVELRLACNLRILGQKGSFLDGMNDANGGNETRKTGLARMGFTFRSW